MELFNHVVKTVTQLSVVMPDSILFGSILLYFITLNKSFGVFAIFIIELILSHTFISRMFKETTGESGYPIPQCFSGYKTARPNVNRMMPNHQYPSYSFFSITAIATYLGLSTREYEDTMKAMGPQWEGRAVIAYMFIIGVLLTVLVVRLAFCEKPSELAIAFVLAILVGAAFFNINKMFFTSEAVNFLGLPYLISKNKDGDTIYVCGKV
jgi:hypothetical protein